MTKINQLRGSKVIQTQELRDRRQSLWQMVQDLKVKAEDYELDYQLQVWQEINHLIDLNISDFLEVASPEELMSLLLEIKDETAGMERTNPDIQELIVQLRESISETMLRVETAAN